MERVRSIIWRMLFSLLPVSVAREYVKKQTNRSPESHGKKQLLIDVSIIVKNDARTGIQRVVRSLVSKLLHYPQSEYDVKLVFASKKQQYCYVNFDDIASDNNEKSTLIKVMVGRGDIFLGLDLATNVLPHHYDQLLSWKKRGVKICIVFYDMLPVLHSAWFKKLVNKRFRHWIRVSAVFADKLVCHTQYVREQIVTWNKEQYGIGEDLLPVGIFTLGANIEESLPSHGIDNKDTEWIEYFKSNECVLMVGTIEPRKGYDQVLSAFEILWNKGQKIHLVMVAKQGWKTEILQERIKRHPQNGKKLFWFTGASDELLQSLYKCCKGVLMASEDEGFGLPVIEAMYFNKPLMVRDIAVFREIAGDYPTYFSCNLPEDFAHAIAQWVSKCSSDEINPDCIEKYTWDESVSQLYKNLQMIH